jgi:regulator of protease activity HflC (stomatin/prohibitin superfamily)
MIVETNEQAAPPPETRWGRFRTGLRRHAFILAVTVFLIVFGIVYLSPSIFYTIGPGQVGVLYLRFFGGTQTDKVLGEGFQMLPPWDRLYIYNVRVQEKRHDMQVLTDEGMSVTLHLSIRYHPEQEMVGLLHSRVGPQYAEQIVIPEVESALRTILGAFQLPEVYGSKREVVQKAINDSLERVSQKYVKVDSIVLRSVELPPKIRDAVEEKMTQKELSDAYAYRLEREKQEAERKTVEAGGIKSYNDILSSSLSPSILKWEAIQATKQLATSPNAKTVVVGTTSGGMPVMLSGDK